MPRKGACACCGIRAKIDDAGALNVLFRSAEEGVNRAELWLQSTNQGKTFAILQEDPWKTATCPASSANFAFMNNRSAGAWETGLEAEAMALLAAGRTDVWEALTKRFESRLILTALANTRGRRIEAAQKLGIGRNTITRKIQELGLDE